MDLRGGQWIEVKAASRCPDTVISLAVPAPVVAHRPVKVRPRAGASSSLTFCTPRVLCLCNLYSVEIYRSKDGSEIGVLAATWELNKKITFESLADEFRRNPVKAWRNYGSIVKHNVESALKDSTVVLRMVNTARSSPWDMTRNEFYPWFRGKAGTRYFIHFDLSETRDATGVAMSHRERRDYGAVSVVDFMLRIEAQMGKNIDYARLRKDFVYEMTNRGFHIQCVSYDQFQSAESRQVLTEKQYEVDEVSADRNMEAYDTTIELLLDSTTDARKLDYYNYPTFIREFEELKLVNGKKYDHPSKSRTGMPGSKDVTDAVACSVLKSIQHELDNPVDPPGVIVVHRARAAHNYGERSRY